MLEKAKLNEVFVKMKRELTVEICENVVVHFGARPEVDELDFVRSGVDQDVLVLDVSVHDAGGVNLTNGLDNLQEDVLGEVLFDRARIGDEIEKVFAGTWAHSLHDDHIAIRQLEVIDQADDTGNVAGLLHQRYLHRDEPFAIAFRIWRLKDEGSVFWNWFYRHGQLIAISDASVNCPEAPFPQHRSNCVELAKLLLADHRVNWNGKRKKF